MNRDEGRASLEVLLHLDVLSRGLSDAERTLLKSRISAQIPEYFDARNELAVDEARRQQFDTLAEVLRRIGPDGERVPRNGIVYRGYPDWLTPDLLVALQAEATRRRHEPLDRHDHYLGCGGTVADSLAINAAVTAFVGQAAGDVEPTGVASYLYYDRAGLGIRPHVDTDVFSVNLMLMLHHTHPDNGEPSATVVFPSGQSPERHRLGVGEVMLMFGGSVIHTRSILREGEVVHLLTIGYKRVGTNASGAVT